MRYRVFGRLIFFFLLATGTHKRLFVHNVSQTVVPNHIPGIIRSEDAVHILEALGLDPAVPSCCVESQVWEAAHHA